MSEQMSPQEADRALREMSDRRNQVTGQAAPWPMIAVSCVLLIAFGFVLDQFSGADEWAGPVLVGVTFVLMYLARTRYVGARLGHRVVPTRIRGAWGARLLALVLLAGAAAVMLVVHAQLVRHDVAWPNTITYGLLGSVLAVAITRVMGLVMRSRPGVTDDRAE